MKNECYVVRDLLPLYLDDLVSDSTREFVESHLAECDECRKEFEKEKSHSKSFGDLETVPLKKINKLLNRQKVRSVLIAVVLVAALLLTGFATLTTPEYLPYSEDLFTVSENEGRVLITFNETVTGYNLNSTLVDEGGQMTTVTYLSAWTTIWDQKILQRGVQSAMINPDSVDGQEQIVFYSPNNGQDAVQISGEKVSYGTMELPRLVLVYYLFLAIGAVVVCGILLIVFNKREEVKFWVERIILFPLAYIVSHVMVKGLKTSTYSSGRDFIIILFISILIAMAGLLGLNWIQNSRKVKVEA